jgi:DNA helicase II / ATP-dependent DNA helicase PcrA
MTDSLSLAAQAQAVRHVAPPDFVTKLNPEQRLAAETLEGPVLVLAGAGTGKTRVLTTRIAHILNARKAWPSEVLSVTFTNKAAREMRERIGKLIGETVEGMPWLGTFHSIGAKMLRKHAELVGLTSNFTILDTDDQIRLLKQLIQAENIDEKRWPARLLASQIDGWKNRGLSPANVPAGEASAYAFGKGLLLYKDYQARLKSLNAVDFGDLLLECIRLFKENPDILGQYHAKFKYILVDEYQDTNVAQYLWLRLLSQHRKNICCVGDDDQSIYGWRGAEVDNILRFDKDFPNAKVIKLERNYRSTGHILGAAAHVIAHNEGRLGKTLFTDDEDGEKVKLTSVWDSAEEARAIGEEAEQYQFKKIALNNMAILVRASFQMREFEERFITIGLNYRVIGGPRFYERAEIRDALAYFRAVFSPSDDLAFQRIINVPKRAIGEASVQMLFEHARKEQIPLMQAAFELTGTDELKPRLRSALRGLLSQFTLWRSKIDALTHTQLAEMILDESGYTAMLKADKSPESQGRLDNLKELIRAMQEFENMAGFLEHITLVTERENAENLDAISIMTLHSAKGLEFETVFLPGWEEGLFPSQRTLDESGKAGLEEERRLAYVGITRARKNAHIYFASNRRIHGMWQSTVPSRFINELPQAHVEIGGGAGSYSRQESFSSQRETPGWQRAQSTLNETKERYLGGTGSQAFGASFAAGRGGFQGRLVDKPRGEVINGQAKGSFNNSSASQFEVSQRVFHLKFGYGEVREVEGNKLTILFDKAGEKKVLDSFVEGV